MSELILTVIIGILGWIIFRVERIDKCLRDHLIGGVKE